MSALPLLLPAEGLCPSSPSWCSVCSAHHSPPSSVFSCICQTVPDSSAVVGIFPWSLDAIWSKRRVVPWPAGCCSACQGGRQKTSTWAQSSCLLTGSVGCLFYWSSSFGETGWHIPSVTPPLSFKTWPKLVRVQDGFGVGEGRGLENAGSWAPVSEPKQELCLWCYSCSCDHSLLRCFFIAFYMWAIKLLFLVWKGSIAWVFKIMKKWFLQNFSTLKFFLW